MSEKLFSLQTDFYIGLVNKTNNAIPRGAAIKDLVFIFGKHGFDSFTVTDTTGFWKGEEEPALKVTLVQSHEGAPPTSEEQMNLAETADKLGENLRMNFYQESVLVVHSEVAGRLIGGSDEKVA